MIKKLIFFGFLTILPAYLAYPARTEWADANNVLTGRVIDAATRQPVAGADVRIQASLTEQTTSAADGTFTLRTARPVGENVNIAAGALDPTGTRPAYYNTKLSVLVGDTGLSLELVPSVMDDDPSYEFTSPQDCRLCHGTLFEYWQDSPHRNAAKNTWVRDIYDGMGTPGTGTNGFVYRQVHPGLLGDCAECHAPMDSAKNPGDHTDFATVSAYAREFGVSCDVCHKTYGITDIRLPGVQGMQFARASRETIFGPLPDAAPNFPGVMRASDSAIHESGLLCAACHEDNNDADLDGDYLDEGSVPSEETYSEWSASSFAVEGPGFKSCQDCHMPPKGDLAMCEQYQPVARDPSQVNSHDFEGTTDEYLKNAATLRVIARRDGASLRVAVAITNDRTGHDLPGGTSIRHAILLVQATDSSGAQLTFEPDSSSVVPDYAGVGDPTMGNYAGLPGKGFAKIFARGDERRVFFTEALSIASDNRIPSGATDWSSYGFQIPEGFVPVRVEAKLIYRRAFRDLAETKGWSLTGHGQPNPDFIGPDFGVVMASGVDSIDTEGPAIDPLKVVRKQGLQLRVVSGSSPLLVDGATVEVTDSVGVFSGFSSGGHVNSGGTKLIQKGKIGGVNLNQYWPNGQRRFVRVTNPDGGRTVLYLERSGSRYLPVVEQQ